MIKVQSSGTHGTGAQQTAKAFLLGMRTGWNMHDTLLSTAIKFNGRRLLAQVNIGNAGVRVPLTREEHGVSHRVFHRDTGSTITAWKPSKHNDTASPRRGDRRPATGRRFLRTVQRLIKVQRHHSKNKEEQGDRRPATGSRFLRTVQRLIKMQRHHSKNKEEQEKPPHYNRQFNRDGDPRNLKADSRESVTLPATKSL